LVAVTPGPAGVAAGPLHGAKHRVHRPAAGSYSGSSGTGGARLSLNVSANHKQLQDVTANVQLGCAPGGSLNDQVSIAEIPIRPDGSFTGKATQQGVVDGSSARFSYRFAGHFHRPKVSGTLREDISYDNGTAYTCTTHSQSWSAARDVQGSQKARPPSAGSYSGSSGSGGARVSLNVSADHKQLQDITASVRLGCSPGGGLNDQLNLEDVPIRSAGSFKGSFTQEGVVEGAPAHFAYSFIGHFHGVTSSGVPRVAGTLREDITYDNGTAYTCTTNNQPWTAIRDAQGSQKATPPAAGSYSGSSGTGGARVSLNVSADHTQIQDVTASVRLGCSPSGGLNDQLNIAEITIQPNGSFAGKASEDGVVGGAPAHFDYSFSGHFHGVTSSGVPRVAGTLREDVTYNDGTAYTCTTNNQSWTATRDTR
jgi:hypothetical protein